MHAREARALSKINDYQRCDRALNAAFDALTTTCDHEPEWCYWIDDTEIHMLAGSCALDLGDPRRALDHFTTAQAAFDTGSFRLFAVFSGLLSVRSCRRVWGW